ncbi:MAG TPA: UDP-N-acetylmuramate--L-alanine ligase [Bacteroidales bacterium]|nr:UDP-N-acetylmuramate--L-alanine ligase [Bacteroidales bacterium]
MTENVYLLGIGGIGMSALARYYKHAGASVQGYDLTPSALTHRLEEEGIEIHYQDDPLLIPPAVAQNRDNTLVIYTPALPPGHRELQWFREKGYHIIKRSVALGHLSANHTTLAVAGTHGKTTTSTLLAHILHHSGTGCTAFLGGISKNYDTNLLLGNNPFLVAEADEFDRSFLQLHPHAALITSADADHLDIYGSHQAVKEAYSQFASQIEPGGMLVIKKGVEIALPLQPGVTAYTYHYRESCDFHALNHTVQKGGYYTFDLMLKGEKVRGCRLGVPGWINVENAVGASALAYLNGVVPAAIKEALASFRGVSRRLDVCYSGKQCCYIDDYAHHPEEIRAAVLSVREWFPGEKITGIFQPHLYTRTRDFAPEFAKSLDLLDQVVLMPVYPARELPIPGVGSEMIAGKMTSKNVIILDSQQITGFVRDNKPRILLTLGAGNIDRLVGPITATLKEMNL